MGADNGGTGIGNAMLLGQLNDLVGPADRYSEINWITVLFFVEQDLDAKCLNLTTPKKSQLKFDKFYYLNSIRRQNKSYKFRSDKR